MSKQLESILKRAPRATTREDGEQRSELKVAEAAPEAAAAEPIGRAAAETRVRDVSLGIEVPETVKRAVNIRAATEGVTNRALLLRALQGIGIEVSEDELRDRRR